jgi:hypothetical protein
MGFGFGVSGVISAGVLEAGELGAIGGIGGRTGSIGVSGFGSIVLGSGDSGPSRIGGR